jgi:Flp pilus assembly protein TadD
MRDSLELARRALGAGAVEEAASLLDEALRHDPDSVEAAHLLGRTRFIMGDHAGAAELLRRAAGQRPDSAELAHDLGFALQRLGKFDEAEAAYGRAMELGGAAGVGEQALAALAELKRLTGALDEAWELASDAFDRGVRDTRLVVTYCRLCARRGDLNRAGGILSQIIGQLADPDIRSEAAFVLGEVCDRLGRYDDAFRAYRHGNELMGGAFDVDSYRRGVDRVIEAWEPEVAAGLPQGMQTSRPVFVVGMPRSGTSLVEQILASHPQIAGAGEVNRLQPIVREVTGGAPLLTSPRNLDAEVVAEAAGSQLDAMEQAAGAADGVDRITDKTPMNYEHLGLIAAMFPKARVIHCQRDPLDTCLSIYFQRFEGRSAAWNRLEWIGAVHRQYRRLMRHWPRVLDLAVLPVRYDEVVSDLEGQARRMLEFVDMPFDESCLRFHESGRVALTASNEQVRRPIYTDSVGRWRNYEGWLEGLRGALGEG